MFNTQFRMEVGKGVKYQKKVAVGLSIHSMDSGKKDERFTRSLLSVASTFTIQGGFGSGKKDQPKIGR